MFVMHVSHEQKEKTGMGRVWRNSITVAWYTTQLDYHSDGLWLNQWIPTTFKLKKSVTLVGFLRGLLDKDYNFALF